MAPVMRGIFSSHVSRVGYDAETKELYVEWSSGKTSVYSGVPSEVAESTTNAWSVGKALDKNIKGAYPHRYLE